MRWRWATAFFVAVAMVLSAVVLLTARDFYRTVHDIDDTLACLLYEQNAHRLANQSDHDAQALTHGLAPHDHGARPQEIPEHLRRACEAILPGSTG